MGDHARAGPGGATVEPSDDRPHLSLGIREVGAAYLGGTSLASLATAGLVREHDADAVAALTAAFGWPRPPFCPDFF